MKAQDVLLRKRASHETARDGLGIHQEMGEFCPKRGQQRHRRRERRQPAGIRWKTLVDALNRLGQTVPTKKPKVRDEVKSM
jgi:hypothetical protein